MELKLFFMIALGLTLILTPSAIGVRLLRKWLSENTHLERRMRDVEKNTRYIL